MKVTYEFLPVGTMLRKRGLSPNGPAQAYLTNIVNRRITRYMPFRTGTLATKLKRITSPTTIEITAPYAAYQYYGVVMIDPKINAAGFMTPEGWRSRRGSRKVLTDRPLQYDRSKNPLAGPFWDRRLVAAEGAAIASELQTYINRGR